MKWSKTLVSAAVLIATLGAANTANAERLGMMRYLANHARVEQAGAGNGSAIAQNGGANGAFVSQNGFGNGARITQNGVNNQGLIRQVGRNNSGSLTQEGDNNAACLFQAGRNHDASIAQVNGGNVGVVQNMLGTYVVSAEECAAMVARNRRILGR